MQRDGARLAKLKEVYKKAVQEILKEEQNIVDFLAANSARDSFFSDSSTQLRQEEVREIFLRLRQRFGDIFKEKVRQSGIDLKLNNIDKYISESRVRCKDLCDEDYVEEIFESYVVDTKESLVKRLEELIEEYNADNMKIESEIEKIEERTKALEQENADNERKYQQICSQLEDVLVDEKEKLETS